MAIGPRAREGEQQAGGVVESDAMAGWRGGEHRNGRGERGMRPIYRHEGSRPYWTGPHTRKGRGVERTHHYRKKIKSFDPYKMTLDTYN